jgi:hypothetical protein
MRAIWLQAIGYAARREPFYNTARENLTNLLCRGYTALQFIDMQKVWLLGFG